MLVSFTFCTLIIVSVSFVLSNADHLQFSSLRRFVILYIFRDFDQLPMVLLRPPRGRFVVTDRP